MVYWDTHISLNFPIIDKHWQSNYHENSCQNFNNLITPNTEFIHGKTGIFYFKLHCVVYKWMKLEAMCAFNVHKIPTMAAYWWLKMINFDNSFLIFRFSKFSDIVLALWCIRTFRKQFDTSLITSKWWLLNGEQFKLWSFRLSKHYS